MEIASIIIPQLDIAANKKTSPAANMHIKIDESAVHDLQDIKEKIHQNEKNMKNTTEAFRAQIEKIKAMQEELRRRIGELQTDVKLHYDKDAGVMVATIYSHKNGSRVIQIPIEAMLTLLK